MISTTTILRWSASQFQREPTQRPFSHTSHFHTCLTVAVRSPNTAVSEPLLFPDFHLLLHLLQALFAGFPSSLSVWRRYGDQDAFLSDVNLPQSMGHGNSHKTMLLSY